MVCSTVQAWPKRPSERPMHKTRQFHDETRLIIKPTDPDEHEWPTAVGHERSADSWLLACEPPSTVGRLLAVLNVETQVRA